MGQGSLRVGVFGLFGGGNSGNEASLEAMLGYLRERHPDAMLDGMSSGARDVELKHGIPVTALSRFESHGRATGIAKVFVKAVGKATDPLHILQWVRKHDVIIVPGMGVLEHTTQLRSYGFPLSIFWVGAAGRACGAKVALVSVGASVISNPGIRFLLMRAARMARYRSYRDAYSMRAVREAGVDTSRDRVFPDLVFSYPTPDYDPGDPCLVGVGVMYYEGTDPAKAAQEHAAYAEKMTSFVRWLLENGYNVRFFGGDDLWDWAVAEQITNRIREQCPAIDADARITTERFGSYAELLGQLNRVGTVIATRYHSVLGALMLCKPTIAVGYADKFTPLMEGSGLGEFTQFAGSLDVGLLIKQFEDLQSRREEFVPGMAAVNAANAERLDEQFAILDDLILGESLR